jgi:hypothetical protein
MNQFEIQHELETLRSVLSLAQSMAETMGSDHSLEGLHLTTTQEALEKASEQLNYEWRVFLWSQTPQDTRGFDADCPRSRLASFLDPPLRDPLLSRR